MPYTKTIKTSIRISATLLTILFISGCGSNQGNRSNVDTSASGYNTNVRQLNSDQEFKDIVSQNDIVLVDFYADWCGPCKVLKPTINDIASNYTGDVTVVAVNIDNFGNLATSFNIQSIPTVNIFHAGNVKASLVGVRSAKEYTKIIDEMIAKKI